jgi:hypothetical protein
VLPSVAMDFESSASANSATPALDSYCRTYNENATLRKFSC